MFKLTHRYTRHLVTLALASILVGALAPASAFAATYTSVSVNPSDSTPSAASTWTITVSNSTGGSVKCLKLYTDTSASFGTTSSSITPTGNPGGSSLFTAGTWTSGPTAVASSSAYKWLSTGGITDASGSSKTFTIATTNPVAGTYYVQLQTFTDTGCTTALDSGTSAVAITANTVVSVTVDPTFTFAVNAQSSGTTCNGIAASTVTSTSSAVPFGHLAASGRAYGAQQLQVTTNAASGYVIYLHSTASSANVLKGSSTHVINDSGSVAVPAAGNSFFGYSTDSTTATITSGNIKSVPQSAGNDVVGNGVAGTNTNNCVTYAAGAAPTTPADTYNATLVYTAVPTF